MSAEPWVRVTLAELEALGSLQRREILVWLAVRALGRNGWAIRRRDVERLAHVSERHVRLSLCTLERRGFLTRQYCGQRKDPWGRFRAETRIPEIRLEGSQGSVNTDPRDPEQGSLRSGYTFQDPDLPDLSNARPPVDPDQSAQAGAGEGGRDRIDPRIAELEPLARELWPDVLSPASFLGRLCQHAPAATAGELAAYLRDAARTVDARYPLGAACSAERWEAWQRRRRRRRRAREDASSPGPHRADDATLSPAELAELADRARRDLH